MTEQEKKEEEAAVVATTTTTNAAAAAAAADKKKNSSSSPPPNLLQRYVYQHPATGVLSSTSLTVQQLCRMFLPPSCGHSKFNRDTQVLALLANGNYDPAGWKAAHQIPILRHVVGSFYYCVKNNDQQQQQGPVSCRQLSQLIYQDKVVDITRDLVYGESTGNNWVVINSVPDFMLALQAFHDAATVTTKTEANNLLEYDVSTMVYPNEEEVEKDTKAPADTANNNKNSEQEVQDELEAFLSSTDHLGGGPHVGIGIGNIHATNDDDDNDETYESDGGTTYVKDPRTGNWIHEALAPPTTNKPPPTKKPKIDNNHQSNNTQNPINNHHVKRNKKKKKTKELFSAKNAKKWIYVTGLPPDTTVAEVQQFFSKVGIIDLDPGNQKPKIKLYRYKQDTHDETTGELHQQGSCKGDASVGYARPESVELALQVLDEAPFRVTIDKTQQYIVRVQRAKFEQHGDAYQKKSRVSKAQLRVAKLAAKQAVDWDEGEFNGRLTGGIKGLRIIVLKGLFHPHELATDNNDEAKLAELERAVRTKCEQAGAVEKITVFAKNPQGVVIVKFAQPGAASEAIAIWNSNNKFSFLNRQRPIEATFWDGVEDYTVRDKAKEQAEMEKRHDAFGDWLESQKADELPEELRLKVED